jgi:hypothetical protein
MLCLSYYLLCFFNKIGEEGRFRLEARGVEEVGEGVGEQRGEMDQTMYTHMNKCINNFLKRQLYREIPCIVPCTCVLQPTQFHLCQTSSLLPSPLPIVASDSLRLLYSILYSEHISHIQVLVSFPFPIPPMYILPLVCDPRPIILLHLF